MQTSMSSIAKAVQEQSILALGQESAVFEGILWNSSFILSIQGAKSGFKDFGNDRMHIC